VASLQVARRRAPAQGRSGITRPVHVLIADGVYSLTEPVIFGPEDAEPTARSPTRPRPALIRSSPEAAHHRLQARSGGVWTAQYPTSAGNGGRAALCQRQTRTRARLPKKFYYYVYNKIAPSTDPATGQKVDEFASAFVTRPGESRRGPHRRGHARLLPLVKSRCTT